MAAFPVVLSICTLFKVFHSFQWHTLSYLAVWTLFLELILASQPDRRAMTISVRWQPQRRSTTCSFADRSHGHSHKPLSSDSPRFSVPKPFYSSLVLRHNLGEAMMHEHQDVSSLLIALVWAIAWSMGIIFQYNPRSRRYHVVPSHIMTPMSNLLVGTPIVSKWRLK